MTTWGVSLLDLSYVSAERAVFLKDGLLGYEFNPCRDLEGFESWAVDGFDTERDEWYKWAEWESGLQHCIRFPLWMPTVLFAVSSALFFIPVYRRRRIGARAPAPSRPKGV
jgi:hypothetical protein